MNLRALLEKAETDLETYKHPDIEEARERLNELLKAADMGGTGNDEITHFQIGRTEVLVSTRYSVRSCEQKDHFRFPTSWLDAPNPVLAAQRWNLQQKKRIAEQALDDAARALKYQSEKLATIKAAIAALPKG